MIVAIKMVNMIFAIKMIIVADLMNDFKTE
jgi:hypothetical protein